MEARATMRPGQKGTRKLVARFGDRLLFVRYRYDSKLKKRFTTVELIFENLHLPKELLFTARVVEAEEACRIGLLNHLVPRAQLRAKTMEIAKMIAANHRGAVMGVKALMLQQMGQGLEGKFNAEQEYTRHVLRGAKAKDAFPDFITRKGLTTS
jgi:enoyl-CoA hydratase/carnithine racemase